MTTTVRPGGLGLYTLEGRTAVVAGGSSGIGAAAARRLAQAGAQVVVGFNNGEDRAQALVAELPGDGHLALRTPVDDSAALAVAAQEIRARYGVLHVLVNSAGVTRAVPHADLEALDDETFDRILRTNVRGVFATIRAFAPLLRESGDAVVVNLSSISAQSGLGSSIAYCASKAAMETMSVSLARVLAPEVRVINISPAAVNTSFVPGREKADVERQAASNALRTVAEPDDIAQAVLAAVTHLRLTTGATVLVDGGRHL